MLTSFTWGAEPFHGRGSLYKKKFQLSEYSEHVEVERGDIERQKQTDRETKKRTD